MTSHVDGAAPGRNRPAADVRGDAEARVRGEHQAQRHADGKGGAAAPGLRNAPGMLSTSSSELRPRTGPNCAARPQ